MSQQYLQEIEYSMLESRLALLREKGASSDTRHLSDAFLALIEDPWTFCGALTDLYAVCEMKDPKRELAVSEALHKEDEEDVMEFMFSDDVLLEETE